jgi:transcription antitermination factor NusA-like protein
VDVVLFIVTLRLFYNGSKYISMLYVFNSQIIPLNWQLADSYTVKIKRIDVNQARQLVNQNQFISAIGHESTAKLLSMLLGIDIPINRIQVEMVSGDIGLHFVLKKRLQEGQIIKDIQELQEIGFDLVMSEVL